MPDGVLHRFSYFLLNPASHTELWTLDLTAVGLVLTAATFAVVLIQRSMVDRAMTDQDGAAQATEEVRRET